MTTVVRQAEIRTRTSGSAVRPSEGTASGGRSGRPSRPELQGSVPSARVSLTPPRPLPTLDRVVVGGELPALGWLSTGPHQRPSPLFSGSSTALSHVGLRNRFEEYREAPRVVFIPIGFS